MQDREPSQAADVPAEAERPRPWVELRSASRHPFVYSKMIRKASHDAAPGDVVAVFDRHGAWFGHGHYNPRSRIVLRMLRFDRGPVDGAFWRSQIERAVDLRTRLLRLPETTDAYRLIHAEGDGLSGLVVDRYADVLSVEVFGIGMHRSMPEILPVLHEAAGTRRHRVVVDRRAQELEGFQADVEASDTLRQLKITENAVRFHIWFEEGHKTGFFCDQRDNRERFAGLCRDARVLDLCCYSGAFGVYAAVKGGAKEVTCVDLDENAVKMARANVDLNNVRARTIQADAFTYLRQLQENGTTFDAVVLDPPKLIRNRDEMETGRRKYADLNRLVMGIVEPGGVLLSCSCSGLVDAPSFVEMMRGAAYHARRPMQFLGLTGAAPDHPVQSNAPQSEYLKAAWMRLG